MILILCNVMSLSGHLSVWFCVPGIRIVDCGQVDIIPIFFLIIAKTDNLTDSFLKMTKKEFQTEQIMHKWQP